MEQIITISDPTLDTVSYVVHVAPGETRWYRVRDDEHELIAPVPALERQALLRVASEG